MFIFIRLGVMLLILAVVPLLMGSSSFAEDMQSLPSSGKLVGESTPGAMGDSGQESRDLVAFEQYRNAGFVAADEPSVGSIIGRLDYWTALNVGDIAYIDIGTAKGAKVGDRYSIFSRDRTVRNPVQLREFQHEENYLYNRPYRQDELVAHSYFLPEPIGRVIQHSGILEIVETGLDKSKAIIRKSNEPIFLGYSLSKYSPIKPAMISSNFIPPKKNLEGVILAHKIEQPSMDGDGEIVYINIGSNHKVAVGDKLVAYLIPQTEDMKVNQGLVTPMLPHIIGNLLVVNVTPNSSSALVTQSDRQITPGTRVRSE